MAQWRRGPLIGRGSSATVSLATTSSTGELFAVKSAELSNSEMLQNEQMIMSSLNCKYIVSYLGFEVTNSNYNLFLEYAPGGSLSDNISGSRMEEMIIRSHTQEIPSGIAYLHANSIVHCDIKPCNILIGVDGQAKIADLGCARWMDDQDNYQVKGTPMFMAPEVVRGEEQGPEADIRALGCTVLEMVTGCAPWPEADPIRVLHRIAFSESVPEIPSWASDEGKDFLKKCLMRDPKQRSTAEQLLKHPFLEQSSTKGTWNLVSPLSIMDRDIWEAFSDEEEVHEEISDDCSKRILDLEGSCRDGPNWTWDESVDVLLLVS